MRRTLHQCDQLKWLDLSHPNKEELIEIQKEFQLHPLFVKDCLDPSHLPKFEKSENTTFVILRIYDAESSDQADSIQSLTRKVAFFIGPDYIITVHRLDPEQFQGLFDASMAQVRDKATERGRLPLFLVHFLIRCLRSFHTPLEQAEADLDSFESALFSRKTDLEMFQDLHIVKRRLNLMKRILIHSQDTIQRLSPSGDQASPFFQDLRESLGTLIFLSDELLDDATSLLGLQISLSAHKTNEVVRVLTVFSVFFMPLTFIAGVYGMNFENQPEFKWPYGYAGVWGLMILVTALIAIWFWRKGWLQALFQK